MSTQLQPTDSGLLAKETKEDSVLSAVQRYTKEGWPHTLDTEKFRHSKRLENSLCLEYGCLVQGSKVVIPPKLRDGVLKLIHLNHYGMQRMKQFARMAVYWTLIDEDFEALSRSCLSCGAYQNAITKPANHP